HKREEEKWGGGDPSAVSEKSRPSPASTISSKKRRRKNALKAGMKNSARVMTPTPAMIESDQASADQTACGAVPAVCSAQLVPVSAQAASTRYMRIAMMTIRISASPIVLSNTRRKGGASICETAL